MSVRARILSYPELGQEADLFLNRYHPTRAVPVPIEEVIELRMHLEIVPWRNLRAVTGVDAFVTRDCVAVYVDADDYIRNLPYLKFTFAEEAAHVWLHGELLRGERVTSDAEWLALRRAVKADPRFELQAKDLAGLILVPPAALEAECTRICETVRDRITADGQISNDMMRRVVLQLLSESFKVSERVIDIRMNCDRRWEQVAVSTTQQSRRLPSEAPRTIRPGVS